MTFVWTNKGAMYEIAADAVDETALAIQDEAKFIAPYDTGNLANSIQVDLSMPGDPTPVAVVYTAVEYAPYVEFGTRHMRAQPFMGPAISKARGLFS